MSKGFEPRKGLIEALASLTGCAILVATLYGLNMIMTPATHDLIAMFAD